MQEVIFPMRNAYRVLISKNGDSTQGERNGNVMILAGQIREGEKIKELESYFLSLKIPLRTELDWVDISAGLSDLRLKGD